MKRKPWILWLPWFSLCAVLSASGAFAIPPGPATVPADTPSEQPEPSRVPKLQILNVLGIDASNGYVPLDDVDVDIGGSVTIREWPGDEPPHVSVRQNQGPPATYGSATRVDEDTWRIDGVRLGTGAERAKSLFLFQAFLPGSNGPKPPSVGSAILKSSEVVVYVRARRLEADAKPSVEVATIDEKTVRTGKQEVVPYRFQLTGTYGLPEGKPNAPEEKPNVYAYVKCDAGANGVLLGPASIRGSLWSLADAFPAGPSPQHKADCTLVPVLSLSPMLAGETTPVDVFNRDRVWTGPEISLRVEPVPVLPVAVPTKLTLDVLMGGDGRAIAVRQDTAADLRDGVVSGSGTIDTMPSGGEIFLVAVQIGAPVATVSAPALLNGNHWDVTALPIVAEGARAVRVFAVILTDRPLPRVPLPELSRHQLAVSAMATVRVPLPEGEKALEVELTHVTPLENPESPDSRCATLGGYVEGQSVPTAAVYAAVHTGPDGYRLVGPAVRNGEEWKIDPVCRQRGDTTLTVIATSRPLGRQFLRSSEFYDAVLAASSPEGLSARVAQAGVGVPLTPAALLVAALAAAIYGWRRFRPKRAAPAEASGAIAQSSASRPAGWGFVVPVALGAVLASGVIFIIGDLIEERNHRPLVPAAEAEKEESRDAFAGVEVYLVCPSGHSDPQAAHTFQIYWTRYFEDRGARVFRHTLGSFAGLPPSSAPRPVTPRLLRQNADRTGLRTAGLQM